MKFSLLNAIGWVGGGGVQICKYIFQYFACDFVVYIYIYILYKNKNDPIKTCTVAVCSMCCWTNQIKKYRRSYRQFHNAGERMSVSGLRL